MRVSEYFALGVGQGGLDFVNIDVEGDVPVYVDPHALRMQSGDWAERCAGLIGSFFEELLKAIGTGDADRVHSLIAPLSEPNETHLGISVGRAKGTSLGSAKKAAELVSHLSKSRAIASGMVADLEETALFVDGIGTDILSDIATCLIRRPLVEYTQGQADFHAIEMEEQYLGYEWSEGERDWLDGGAVRLPRGPDGPLLFVPRAIVRARLTLDKDKYFTGYIRPIYEDEELAKGVSSQFVRLVYKGTKRAHLVVNKTELGEALGSTKNRIVDHTAKHPTALDKYRDDNKKPTKPLTNEQLEEIGGEPATDAVDLLAEIQAISAGKGGAYSYHHAVAKLLTCLFDTSLGNMKIEQELHGGDKRIDITYDNVAAEGFFRWLGQHYPAAVIVVECKNYTKDPKNPELDQIAMRLNPTRGQFGLLLTRKIEKKNVFRRRCRDAAADGHGYVVALDDDDLVALVGLDDEGRGQYLRDLFGDVIGLTVR